MRSEWDVVSPNEAGELQTGFARMKSQTMGGGGWDDGKVRNKVRKETEQRIAEALRGGDENVRKLSEFLRAGVVKRATIAERLGIDVTEGTNCRKRLDRKLDELEKAGCPGWAIEEWKWKQAGVREAVQPQKGQILEGAERLNK
jgi:hypothetical protein